MYYIFIFLINELDFIILIDLDLEKTAMENFILKITENKRQKSK